MKFVVISSKGQSIQECVFKDLLNKENIDYHQDLLQSDNKLLRKIFNHHFTDRINLPFKRIWNRNFAKNKFNYEDEVCYLFTTTDVRYAQYGLLNYLKKKHKKCYFVYYMQDLVEKNKSRPLDFLNKNFDLIYSFDKGDCEKHGYKYFPLVYSDLSAYLKEDEQKEMHDICFVGIVKDRYNAIIKAYERLTELGFDCDFYLFGVKKEDRKYENKIKYLDKKISYIENINLINKSKAILEIMQGNGNSFTLRFDEVVYFKKKFITNNKNILEIKEKYPNVVWYFDNPEEINIDKSAFYDNSSLDRKDFKLSPLDLLDDIESQLKGK